MEASNNKSASLACEEDHTEVPIVIKVETMIEEGEDVPTAPGLNLAYTDSMQDELPFVKREANPMYLYYIQDLSSSSKGSGSYEDKDGFTTIPRNEPYSGEANTICNPQVFSRNFNEPYTGFMKEAVTDKGTVATPSAGAEEGQEATTGHQNDVEKAKGNVCSLCDKAFVRGGQLRRHYARVHTAERPFACNICNKRFATAWDLKMHGFVHTREKKHVCDVCSRAFSRAGYLRKHKVSHTGAKDFFCVLCKKAFATARYLKIHLRTHTGERPYVCNVCGKAFAQNSGMRTHMKLHTGEREHKCQRCDKAFRRREHLEKHMKVHRDERPYLCIIRV